MPSLLLLSALIYTACAFGAGPITPKGSRLFSSAKDETITGDKLVDNLTGMVDRWIITGAPGLKTKIADVMTVLEADGSSDELDRARRLVTRAGFSLDRNAQSQSLGETDSPKRRSEAEDRANWEETRTSTMGNKVKSTMEGRSALSRRSVNTSTGTWAGRPAGDDLEAQKFAQDKKDLEQVLKETDVEVLEDNHDAVAAARVSELVAKAGLSFEGEALGIGGLDDVLSEVKRRIWTPLAAPPSLLQDLGIQPVKGLLLYGLPGCGKTLLARTLGQILSPLRPVTIVSGPEIMDKFVGSSEKNLRAVFDNPPDIYDTFRLGEKDGGSAISNAALHIIIMDEFDAIARSRGGRGGSGDQGDAGVARDSVVNQLLARMDGVDGLSVPTLVIGLTNKRSLIDPALLRPGRFEVQIEVPPPKTFEQRISILQVHMKNMFTTGRLLVRDAPLGSIAANLSTSKTQTYPELLEYLGKECDGFTGASLAGVVRAAASHALERSVEEFSQNPENGSLLQSCVVDEDDFALAVQDVRNSLGAADYSEEEDDDEVEPKSQE